MRIQFEAKEEFTNHFGVIQGGFLAAMLDDTLGPAVASVVEPDDAIATIEIKVSYLRPAQLTLRRMKRLGLEELPICVAKTQYSLSDDPALLGRPQGFEFHVREVRASAGAGFLVIIAGEIMTMPGLPKEPAATRFRLGGE